MKTISNLSYELTHTHYTQLTDRESTHKTRSISNNTPRPNNTINIMKTISHLSGGEDPDT